MTACLNSSQNKPARSRLPRACSRPARPYLGRSVLSIAVCLLALLPAAYADDQPEEFVDNALLEKLEASVLSEQGFADEYDAQVWFKSMFPRLQPFKKLAEDEKLQILQWVHRESHLNDLDPSLVLAVIQVESSFDRYAISRSGAQGLMQVMSFWKQELGRPEDNLIETQTNLRYGTTILAYYLEMADGDTTEALARYNGSYPQTWYAERVYNAWDIWR